MATPSIRPLADRILVKRLEEDERAKGRRIIIPDTAKENPREPKWWLLVLAAWKTASASPWN